MTNRTPEKTTIEPEYMRAAKGEISEAAKPPKNWPRYLEELGYDK